MEKVLVVFDVSNLYLCGQRLGKKVDYVKLLQTVLRGRELFRAIAYGAQMEDEAAPFINMLRSKGFYTKYKVPKIYGNERKADWDVGIAVDMIRFMDQYNTAILCSADGDMLPVVQYLQERGRRVEVYGLKISSDLRAAADFCCEISDVREEKNEITISPV